MRALIISDIHGALEPVLKIEKLAEKADLVICLGDVLYHGPRNDLPSSYNPKAVIPVMNSLSTKIIAVRGNCDAEVDQMVLSFPILSTTALVHIDGYTLTLSHGHIYSESQLPPGAEIFLYGHTHIPVAKKENGITIFNPGSVSIPKGGHSASYGLYEEGMLSVRRLEDDEIMMAVKLD